MNHISQPKGSKLCGQSCVAMIEGISLDYAIKKIGHKRGTYGVELLKSIGINGRLKRWTRFPLPDKCLMSLRYNNKKGHWAIKNGLKVLDPAFPYEVDWDVWFKISYEEGLLIKSFYDLETIAR